MTKKKEAQWTRPFFIVIAALFLLMAWKVIGIGLFGVAMLLALLAMLFFVHSRHKAEKNRQEIAIRPSASFEKTRELLNNKIKKPAIFLFYTALLVVLFSSFAKDLGMLNASTYFSLTILIFSGGYVAIFYNLADSLLNYDWKSWPEMFQQENPDSEKPNLGTGISFSSVAVLSLSYMAWRFWKYDLLSDKQGVLLIAVVLSLVFTGFILKKKFQGITSGIRETISHPIQNFGLVLMEAISILIVVVYVGFLFYIF